MRRSRGPGREPGVLQNDIRTERHEDLKKKKTVPMPEARLG